MKKLFSIALAGALLTLGASAYAIAPGNYVDRRYAAADGFFAVYGEVKICRLEGYANLPKIEVFSIITRDGIEPMECYAGIINQNGPARATGTLMYKMTNNERIEAMRNQQKGSWLADINSTENNIRFNFIDSRHIDFEGFNGHELPVYSAKSYEYFGPEMGTAGEAVMKIVALAKVRSLLGENCKVKDQSYKLVHMNKEQELLIVQEQGKQTEYLISHDLNSMTDVTKRGSFKSLLVGRNN